MFHCLGFLKFEPFLTFICGSSGQKVRVLDEQMPSISLRSSTPTSHIVFFAIMRNSFKPRASRAGSAIGAFGRRFNAGLLREIPRDRSGCGFCHRSVWWRPWPVAHWRRSLRGSSAQSGRRSTYSDDDDLGARANRIAGAVCVACCFRQDLKPRNN